MFAFYAKRAPLSAASLHLSFSKSSVPVPSPSCKKQLACITPYDNLNCLPRITVKALFVLCVGSVLGLFQSCLLLWLGWHLSLLAINDALEVMSGFEVSPCWWSQRERARSWLRYKGEFLWCVTGLCTRPSIGGDVQPLRVSDTRCRVNEILTVSYEFISQMLSLFS